MYVIYKTKRYRFCCSFWAKSFTKKNGNEITLFEPGPIPTQAELDGYVVEYEAHLNAIAYQGKRREEYPSIEDVTVALAEKAEGDSTMWDEITAKRQAIKIKYPKG